MSRADRRVVAVARDEAPLFAALGDPTRLGVVLRLSAGGPESIVSLSAHAEVSRQAITRHLEVLAAAGLVRGTRRGREHIWALEPGRLDEARAFLDRVSREWGSALARLAHLVEDR